MIHVTPSNWTATASFAIGLMCSAGHGAAQPQSGEMGEVFSFAFDRCLEILRTQDPGEALRANREQHPNSICIGAGVGETDVVITICDDARSNPDAPTIQSCNVRTDGVLDVRARLDSSRWAEQMQTALSQFDGIAELPAGHDRTLPRYSWCEDDDKPFYVEFSEPLPGLPIQVSIYTFGASHDDPNPCEQE